MKPSRHGTDRSRKESAVKVGRLKQPRMNGRMADGLFDPKPPDIKEDLLDKIRETEWKKDPWKQREQEAEIWGVFDPLFGDRSWDDLIAVRVLVRFEVEQAKRESTELDSNLEKLYDMFERLPENIERSKFGVSKLEEREKDMAEIIKRRFAHGDPAKEAIDGVLNKKAEGLRDYFFARFPNDPLLEGIAHAAGYYQRREETLEEHKEWMKYGTGITHKEA